MRHASTLRAIGLGVLLGAAIVAMNSAAAADGPQRHAGKKRSWNIVPKGSAADIGGNKSPGQGSAPASMAFLEPAGNGPKRTSPSSQHVQAPEANPSSSARVQAPSVPDQPPATTPSQPSSPQHPTGPSGQGGNLGDLVTAVGAIAQMASGMMGQGDPGYGEMGYGDDGGSYTYDDPDCYYEYEEGYSGNATGFAVSDVPANPSPAARMYVAIVNPAENGVALQFLLDGQLQKLEAGTRVDFTAVRPVEIKFDRGESFGRARYKLDEHRYTFKPSPRGWELYRSQYVAPNQQ